VKALAQVEAPQPVPIGCRRQAPAPLQPPARPQVAAASAAHWLRGSIPDGTRVQVPWAPPTLQALHVSPHALSQQNPSTQKLLAHWNAMAHAMPLVRFTVHLLLSQKKPVWH
jgi:hypothetical protein